MTKEEIINNLSALEDIEAHIIAKINRCGYGQEKRFEHLMDLLDAVSLIKTEVKEQISVQHLTEQKGGL